MRSIFPKAGWVLAGVLSLALVASLSGIVRSGPLDPPGAPAPTLSEIEPRIALHPPASDAALPIVISQPGSYYLAGNIIINSCTHNGIEIAADDVTLDLNGMVLHGSMCGTGIYGSGTRDRITVRNGRFIDWDTAIDFNDDLDVLIEDVDLYSGLAYGVNLGPYSVLRDCTIREFQQGVHMTGTAGIVRDCRIIGSRNEGIDAAGDYAQVIGNSLDGNAILGCCAAVKLGGKSGLADGNNIIGSASYGLEVGNSTMGAFSRVVRNTFRDNGNKAINRVAFCLSDGDCDIGTETSALLATNPMSNIED